MSARFPTMADGAGVLVSDDEPNPIGRPEVVAETIRAVEVAAGGISVALIVSTIVLYVLGEVSLASVLVMALPAINYPIMHHSQRGDVMFWELLRVVYNLATSLAIYVLTDGFLDEFWMFGFLTVASSGFILVVHTRRMWVGLVLSAVGGVTFLLAGVAIRDRAGAVFAIVLTIAAAGFLMSLLAARLGRLVDRLHDANEAAIESKRRIRGNHTELIQILQNIPENLQVVALDGRTVFLNERIVPPGHRAAASDDHPVAPWERFALVRRGSDQPYPRAELPVSLALGGCTSSVDDLDLLLRLDGGMVRRSLTSSAAPIVGTDGEVRYALATYQDVTDKLQVESDRLRSHKLESVGQLAAGLAQEIDTSMQYIGDNAQFLGRAVANMLAMIDRYAEIVRADEAMQEEAAAAAQRLKIALLRQRIPEAIGSTVDEVERVMTTVAAVRELSSPVAEVKSLTDLNRAIETVRTVSKNEWQYAADFLLDLDDDLPLVPCLPGELEQVLLNLVVNAAHAITDANADAPLARGRIAISTTVVGRRVEVRVADNGGGIPDAIRDRVFDPFVTTKIARRGAGQGLAVARSIVVDHHQGTIDFDVEPGVGTTFVVRLPIVDPADELGADELDAAGV